MSGRELNVMLSVLHGILLLVLLFTTFNYLLGSLYDDRKDRSILFWRSMPVSEREIVLSKFVMAMVVAPLIYIAVSLLLQLAYVCS
jgi:ABC-2 type transport system permease protein